MFNSRSRHLITAGILQLATISLGVSEMNGQHIEWEHVLGDAEGVAVLERPDRGFILLGAMPAVDGIPASTEQGMIIITDSDGDKTSMKLFGGSYQTSPRSLLQNADGSYTVVGQARRSASGADSDLNIYVARLNATGELQSETSFGTGLDDRFGNVVRTTDGGLAIASFTDDTTRLFKTDAAGALQWQQSYPVIGTGPTYAVIQAKDGGYLLGGRTRTKPSIPSDVFLLKTNSAGKIEWQQGTSGGTPDAEIRFLFGLETGGYFAIARNIAIVNQSIALATTWDGWTDFIAVNNTYGWIADVKLVSADTLLQVGLIANKDSSHQISIVKRRSGSYKLPLIWHIGVPGEVRVPRSIVQTSDGKYVITGTAGSGEVQGLMLMKVSLDQVSGVQELPMLPVEIDLSDITPECRDIATGS